MLAKILAHFGLMLKSELNKEVDCIRKKNAELQEQKDELEIKNQSLEMAMQELKFQKDVIAGLLGNDNKTQALQEFRDLLYSKFIAFANTISLDKEAEAIIMLQNIETEIEVISAYSEIHHKHIIAVGGSFSAGKSVFISSFLSENIGLPSSIEPTTAIPTYVLDANDGSHHLIGITKNGGTFDLSEIDSNIHQKLEHSFITRFGFDIKKIMPFMVLLAPLDYKDICFIDTPGYNAPKSGSTETDMQVAQDSLQNCDSLIWLVRTDNGSLGGDIEFLQASELQDKKLYIVLSRADEKSPTERNEILENIKEELECYGINYEGISLYSAKEKEEYGYEKQSLKEFLQYPNKQHNLQKKLIGKLYAVATMYQEAILDAEQNQQEIYDELHSLELDLLQDFEELPNECEARLENLKRKFQKSKAKNSLKELEHVIIQMKESIDKIFDKILAMPYPEVKKTKKSC